MFDVRCKITSAMLYLNYAEATLFSISFLRSFRFLFGKREIRKRKMENGEVENREMENREMVLEIRQRGSLNEERIKAEGMAAVGNGWSGWVNNYRTPVACAYD